MAVPARRLQPPPRRPARPLRPVRPSGTRKRPDSTSSRRSGRSAAARRRRSSRRLPFVVFAMLVITAMVVALASAQAFVAQTSFRVTELQRRTVQLEQEYGQLRLEAARLSSPQRIARAAKRAGLILPDDVELLAVRGLDRDVPPSVPDETLALRKLAGGPG